MTIRIEQSGEDVLLWIKAVPGASRSQIAGPLGQRLKLRISAPPEAGKANAAICELLADTLKLKHRDVSVESGHSNPEKTIRIRSTRVDQVRSALLGG